MWYILNYIPGRGHRRDGLPAVIESVNKLLVSEGRGVLELFAPTFVQLKEDGGHVHKTEKPLLFHYIFVNGGEREVKELCHKAEGFSLVFDRAGADRYLSLSDNEMEQFKIIAQFYAGKLPCYPLDGVSLEEGDRVQVASGPCAGLTGTYMSRKGGKSGNILVAVDGTMAAIVYDVKAEYVRVLEFARDSKRAYDQIDAYASKLAPLLREAKPPTIADISLASVFTHRLGIAKLHNPKLDAKLQILLYAAYCVLSDRQNAGETLRRFRELESNVTNAKTRALCDAILIRWPG